MSWLVKDERKGRSWTKQRSKLNEREKEHDKSELRELRAKEREMREKEVEERRRDQLRERGKERREKIEGQIKVKNTKF